MLDILFSLAGEGGGWSRVVENKRERECHVHCITNASGKEYVCFIPRVLKSNFSNTSAGIVDYTYIHTYI